MLQLLLTGKNKIKIYGVNSDNYVYSGSGLTFEGSSLVLKSKTSYVLYFSPNESYTGAVLEYVRDGETIIAELTMRNGLVRFEITGIEAGCLEDDFDVVINGTSYTVNPGIYFVLARNETEQHNQTTLAELMRSMYYYNRNAKSYKS